MSTEDKPPAPTLEGGQLVDHRDGRDVVLKLRGVRTQFGDNVIHNKLDLDVFRGLRGAEVSQSEVVDGGLVAPDEEGERGTIPALKEIGRASCRERVCQYV